MRVDCFGYVSEETIGIMMDNVFELGVDDSHGNVEHAGDCANRMPITFSNLSA
jgi:hypothetical protein